MFGNGHTMAACCLKWLVVAGKGYKWPEKVWKCLEMTYHGWKWPESS